MADEKLQGETPPIKSELPTVKTEQSPLPPPPAEVEEQPAEVCTRVDISTEQLMELVEEADDRFAHIGGTKYEYIHQVFLPLLKERGYVICNCN